MSEPELKPCPVCGNAPFVDVQSYKSEWPDDWLVRCVNDDCPVYVSTCVKEDRRSAIKAWNTRAQEDEK